MKLKIQVVNLKYEFLLWLLISQCLRKVLRDHPADVISIVNVTVRIDNKSKTSFSRVFNKEIVNYCFVLRIQHQKTCFTTVSMVKFGKNKLKMLNKLSKAEKNELKIAGKITKKKNQAAPQASTNKKVSIIKELATTNNDLVEIKTGENKKQLRFARTVAAKESKKPVQPKQKPIEKQKKRQKTQINDIKMVLKLMKKK